MIHITTTSEGCTTLHLRLEGMLDDAHAVALRDVIDEARASGIRAFVLDCAGMTGAEGTGLDLLRALKQGGATFRDLPVTLAWHLGLLHTTQSGSIQPS
jgi:anti-anti-sigma regulatory factor